MKIAHICISERYIENSSYQENLLAIRHVQLGHKVYVIAADRYVDKNRRLIKRKVENYVNHYGVNVTILPPKWNYRFTGAFRGTTNGLYNRLCEISPEIIMVHGVEAKENSSIAKYAMTHSRTRVFADNHNDYYNSPRKTIKEKLWGFVGSIKARELVKVTQCFWGTTPWRVEYLQDVYKIPAEKTGLLIMGADEKFILGKSRSEIRKNVREQYGIPGNAYLVVTGGTLDKRKQQNLLFEAVSQLKQENVWLLAFGEPTEEMQPVFDTYKSVSNIVMTGWLAAEKAYDLFMASELAFFPGTHSVLWEQAVACATPLVVKHWHGMEHVNVNGNAVLMDEISTETIIRQIQILNYTHEYEEMSKRAAEISSQFYLTEIAKKVIGLE